MDTVAGKTEEGVGCWKGESNQDLVGIEDESTVAIERGVGGSRLQEGYLSKTASDGYIGRTCLSHSIFLSSFNDQQLNAMAEAPDLAGELWSLFTTLPVLSLNSVFQRVSSRYTSSPNRLSSLVYITNIVALGIHPSISKQQLNN